MIILVVAGIGSDEGHVNIRAQKAFTGIKLKCSRPVSLHVTFAIVEPI
jgi:hypothetical protein